MTENNLVESKPENPIHFTILIGTCTVILSVTLCTLCGLIAFCVAKSRKTIVCPLCKYSVLKRDWNSGIHREVCAKRNEFYLKQLPEPFDIRCPTCLRYLKLMPEVSSKWGKMSAKCIIFVNHFSFQNFGKDFECDDRDCPIQGNRILNNGHNRISCFVCDYDICDSCVHRRIYVLSKVIKKNKSDSKIYGTKCDLALDVYPVVPTVSSQIPDPSLGFWNHGFSDSESGSCVLDHPDSIDLPLNHPPYLLSTYVW